MLRLIVLATLLAFLSISIANSHDHWINESRLIDPFTGEWCCNDKDCKPERVQEVFNGYMTSAPDFVIKDRVIWKSQDGHWWRCNKIVNGKDTTRCLIGPPPGS